MLLKWCLLRGAARVVRVDEDPATLDITARRLVNLQAVSPGSSGLKSYAFYSNRQPFAYPCLDKSMQSVASAHATDDVNWFQTS